MEDLVGEWSLESRDNNFDEFLKCRQVSWFLRTMMTSFPADVEYSLSDDKKILTKTTKTSVKTSVYPMDTEKDFFPDKSLSGQPEYGRVFETSGRKILQEMRFKSNDEVAAIIERQVTDNKMFVKLKCKDIVCNEVYWRKPSEK